MRPAVGRPVIQGRSLADEPAEPVRGGFGQQAADGDKKVRDIERLFQERAHARTQGGKKLIRAPGGDDDGQEWLLGAETFEGVPAVLEGHIEVEDHEIHRKGLGDDERFVAVGGREDEETFFGEHASEGFTDSLVVIHDQDVQQVRFRRRPLGGRPAVRARRMLFLGVHESKTW